jgi:hypothetical protein
MMFARVLVLVLAALSVLAPLVDARAVAQVATRDGDDEADIHSLTSLGADVDTISGAALRRLTSTASRELLGKYGRGHPGKAKKRRIMLLKKKKDRLKAKLKEARANGEPTSALRKEFRAARKAYRAKAKKEPRGRKFEKLKAQFAKAKAKGKLGEFKEKLKAQGKYNLFKKIKKLM